ncbi:MAG TPA: hypothetical protein VGP94_11250 [Tepidisphaeraceae bacterium]|nr:hypothetical protein [Tepidisphaeraceae bacterium]
MSGDSLPKQALIGRKTRERMTSAQKIEQQNDEFVISDTTTEKKLKMGGLNRDFRLPDNLARLFFSGTFLGLCRFSKYLRSDVKNGISPPRRCLVPPFQPAGPFYVHNWQQHG